MVPAGTERPTDATYTFRHVPFAWILGIHGLGPILLLLLLATTDTDAAKRGRPALQDHAPDKIISASVEQGGLLNAGVIFSFQQDFFYSIND